MILSVLLNQVGGLLVLADTTMENYSKDKTEASEKYKDTLSTKPNVKGHAFLKEDSESQIKTTDQSTVDTEILPAMDGTIETEALPIGSETSGNVNATVSEPLVNDTRVEPTSEMDYTLDLRVPSEVKYASSNGYIGFSYQVVIQSNASLSEPLKSMAVDFIPPQGYKIDRLPLGQDSLFKDYKVNSDNTVAIQLNDINKGIVTFVIPVIQIMDSQASNNFNHRYNGEKLDASISGQTSFSNKVSKSTAQTTLKGSTDYIAIKKAKVSPGTDFRTVTYQFDAKSNGSYNQFSLNKLLLNDVIPSGAIIVSSRDAGGKWTITGDQNSGWQAQWQRDGIFTGDAKKLSNQDSALPELVVKYPSASFETGKKPPENVVTISGYDSNINENNGLGHLWTGTAGKAQSVPLEKEEKASSAISTKIDNKNWLSGAVYGNYEVTANYIGSEDNTSTVRSMAIEDTRDLKDNQLFWEHFLLSNIVVELNSKIIASQADYVLEYQTNKKSWRVADNGKATAKKVIGFHVEGSVNYQNFDKLDKDIGLSSGEILTGWRMKINDAKGNSIGREGEATIKVVGVPSYVNIFNGGGGDAVSQVTNTASQKIVFSDDTVEEKRSSASTKISPNLNLNTVIESPKRLETNQSSSYRVWVSNITPIEETKGAVLRIVLPAGVTLDESKGIVSAFDKMETPYQFEVPEPGRDIVISTEILPSGKNYKGDRQVVILRFKKPLPSLLSVVGPSDRQASNKGFAYDLPVIVSQHAMASYIENQSAPVESWITTDSNQFTSYSVSAYGKRNHQDIHGFDSTRASIVWDSKDAEVTSQGGISLKNSVAAHLNSEYKERIELSEGEEATWRQILTNSLTTSFKNIVIFNKLNKLTEESTFVTTLTGPVKTSPGGVVMYSKDGNSATSGSWTTDWKDATAYKITFSEMKPAEEKIVTVPVKVPKGLNQGDVTKNISSVTGEINGNAYSTISNSAQITIVNPSNSVILQKKDKHTGEQLSGAVFKLIDSKGKVVKKELVTDSKGEVLIGDLAIGKYQFIETKAPFGYQLDATPVSFEVVNGQIEMLRVIKMNKALPGKVIIEAVDEETGEKLAGASFEIRDIKGHVIKGGLMTNDKGSVAVHDLSPGKYQLSETKPPLGYRLKNALIDFEMIKGQEDVTKLVVSHEAIPGGVTLEKIDEETGERLSSAIFELRDNDNKIIKKGLTTDDWGRLFVADLPAGDYQFVETKAPLGYQLDKKPLKFKIPKKHTESIKLKISNQVIPGSVILEKIDEETGEKLSGAEFKLETEAGKLLIEDMVTDSTGKLLLLDLKPGKYKIIETKAPKGYQLDDTPIEIQVATTR